MIKIKPTTVINRNINSFDRFHEVIITMKNPCIVINEDYGYLELKAWNKDGVCFYHFTDKHYYPPVIYADKLREIAKLIQLKPI